MLENTQNVLKQFCLLLFKTSLTIARLELQCKNMDVFLFPFFFPPLKADLQHNIWSHTLVTMVLSKGPEDNGSFPVKQRSECLQTGCLTLHLGLWKAQAEPAPAHSLPSTLLIACFHSLQQHIFNYWERILSLIVVEKVSIFAGHRNRLLLKWIEPQL